MRIKPSVAGSEATSGHSKLGGRPKSEMEREPLAAGKLPCSEGEEGQTSQTQMLRNKSGTRERAARREGSGTSLAMQVPDGLVAQVPPGPVG